LRVRSFIDFVVERLGRSPQHVLDARELAAAQALGSPKTRRGARQR
jgi:hypothetical protein